MDISGYTEVYLNTYCAGPFNVNISNWLLSDYAAYNLDIPVIVSYTAFTISQQKIDQDI